MLLWLSAVSTNFRPRLKGYASATRRAAPVALAVKITVYSAGSAFRWERIVARVSSMREVAAEEVGLVECGFPKTVVVRRVAEARYWDCEARAEPV